MMRVHRSSLAACALAMVCLSASPASSGLPSHSSRSASGKVPSGEIPPAPTGAGEIRIAPLASRPGGRTYGRWVAAWTRWAVQTRAAAHPLLDTTADCRTGQQGKVWFLGGKLTPQGTAVERRCTVPSGTALFFPLANEFWVSTPKLACVPADPWYGATPAARRKWALFERGILERIRPPRSIDRLSLRIDGKPAGDLAGFFVRSPVFSARLPADNIFDRLETCGADDIPGFLATPSIAWGHYVYLEPLPPGGHTLRWRANLRGGVFAPSLRQDITYRITVAPAGAAARTAAD
jgi:hypothetical protein